MENHEPMEAEYAEPPAVIPRAATPVILKMDKTPEATLTEAAEAAKALRHVIDTNTAVKPQRYGKKEHLGYELWQTCGHFYGLAPQTEWTRYVEYGPAAGFEARVNLIHTATGAVVSSAQMMCMNDEENWSARPKYEWQGSERVLVGSTPVPLFQLQSMAQTRAASKAFRMVLSRVAVLAGYDPTPAEEMEGVYQDRPAPAARQTTAKPAQRPAAKPAAAPSQAPAEFTANPGEPPLDQDDWDQLKRPPTMQGKEMSNGKMKYGIETCAEGWIGVFSETLQQRIVDEYAKGTRWFRFQFVKKGQFKNLESVTPYVERKPDVEPIPVEPDPRDDLNF